MSTWGAAKANRVFTALLRLGWVVKRQSGSHCTLSRLGWPDYVSAFHDGDETLLADANIDVGDAVDVAVHKGALVITPVRRVRGGHDLRELVRRIPKGYTAENLDWGPPAGREAW